MQKEIKNLEELRSVADDLLSAITKSPLRDTAVVIGLSGDLGAGKTAFTKCVASILGISEVVTSPTFILEKVYIIPRGSVLGERFAKLIHIDAYRLETASDMRALAWDALLQDEKNLIFIEWPEQVEDAMPEDMIKISFKYAGEGIRQVAGELI
ncbi:MAG: tRNA (adenosine(37)-N6)-threonylcarbamoyltransferase complex ATPase subunit type 1 TsaE [Candidatus Yonathbacteria bacterium]|nr:tRNA (adenosine(37)-N6)-threonylcarbamoyltransferase complex ATPase subunit type 1 TsaE [Candidatus Yonathbacteria bacterium]